MVLLFHAATNQPMVILFDATGTFDATTIWRVVAHPYITHHALALPDTACSLDWNWFKIVFN